MKTTLKPKMKAAELSMSFGSTRASWDFSSSTPVPEINDTYPGTSGRTHGERKEISPARNAAMGRGKLDMCFFNLRTAIAPKKMCRLARTPTLLEIHRSTCGYMQKEQTSGDSESPPRNRVTTSV